MIDETYINKTHAQKVQKVQQLHVLYVTARVLHRLQVSSKSDVKPKRVLSIACLIDKPSIKQQVNLAKCTILLLVLLSVS